MGRIIKRFGLVAITVVVLLLVFSGSILAAGGNPDKGNQGEECPCGQNICGDCIPKDHSYDWGFEFEPSGPHGPYGQQHGKVAD